MFWNTYDNTSWSPWQELRRIQSDMQRLFEDRTAGRTPLSGEFPRLNLWTGEHGLKLVAQLPGLDAENLSLSVVGDTLTLKGARDDAAGDDQVHRRERQSGSFTRSVQLPYEIEADEVAASFKNGVLEVDLPRARAGRPRQINVQTA